MRIPIQDIDALKRKAKLLKKYLWHPCIGREGVALGAIQRAFALGHGFSSWAEASKAASIISDAGPIGDLNLQQTAFDQLSAAIGSLGGLEMEIAEALVFRIGFTPSRCLRIPKHRSVSRIVLMADIVVDRLVEADDIPQTRAVALAALGGIHNVIAYTLTKEDMEGGGQTYTREEALEFSEHWDAGQWIEAISLWKGAVLPDWRTRIGEAPRYQFTDVRRIEKFASSLPKSGLLLMSGCTGSGRSLTAMILSMALRQVCNSLFHISSHLKTSADIRRPHGVYADEVREAKTLIDAVESNLGSVAMVQLAAGSAGSAYARTASMVESARHGHGRSWLNEHLIGGFHHELDSESNPKRQRITWWSAKDAIVSRPFDSGDVGRVSFSALTEV